MVELKTTRYYSDMVNDEYNRARTHWNKITPALKMVLEKTATNTYKSCPEEIILEIERRAFIINFLHQILLKLTRKSRHCLFVYTRNDYNATKTGEQLNISNVAVLKHIGKARDIANQILSDMGLTNDVFKLFTYPEVRYSLPFNGIKVGYPYENYMNLPQNKSWVCKFGRKKFPINKSCLIPEYLEFCGCPHSVCPICCNNESCTRSDKFPDNKKTTPVVAKNYEKVKAILTNIAS